MSTCINKGIFFVLLGEGEDVEYAKTAQAYIDVGAREFVLRIVRRHNHQRIFKFYDDLLNTDGDPYENMIARNFHFFLKVYLGIYEACFIAHETRPSVIVFEKYAAIMNDIARTEVARKTPTRIEVARKTPTRIEVARKTSMRIEVVRPEKKTEEDFISFINGRVYETLIDAPAEDLKSSKDILEIFNKYSETVHGQLYVNKLYALAKGIVDDDKLNDFFFQKLEYPATPDEQKVTLKILKDIGKYDEAYENLRPYSEHNERDLRYGSEDSFFTEFKTRFADDKMALNMAIYKNAHYYGERSGGVYPSVGFDFFDGLVRTIFTKWQSFGAHPIVNLGITPKMYDEISLRLESFDDLTYEFSLNADNVDMLVKYAKNMHRDFLVQFFKDTLIRNLTMMFNARPISMVFLTEILP